MDIRDVEQKTGLSRANIRFYEKEGLLSPARRENGYRDYSEENAEFLLKIKLLRQLGVAVEDIRKLSDDELKLESVIRTRLSGIRKESRELEISESICRKILDDGAEFRQMNAAEYLNYAESLRRTSAGSTFPKAAEAAVQKDVEKTVSHPWRRFLAYEFDSALYAFLLTLVIFGLLPLKWPLQTGPLILTDIFFLFAGMGLMLLFEPLLLSRFGTTPGKALMGYRVLHESGRRMSVPEARERTIEKLHYGLGFHLPIYSIIRFIKSAKDYGLDDQELFWDRACEPEFKEAKLLRNLLFAAALILVTAIAGFIRVDSMTPKHRGALTTEAFIENYNDMSRYLGDQDNFTLNPDGVLEYSEQDGLAVYVGPEVPAYMLLPEFDFETENGFVTAVTLRYELDAAGKTEYPGWVKTVPDEVRYAMSALLLSDRTSAFRGAAAWTDRIYQKLFTDMDMKRSEDAPDEVQFLKDYSEKHAHVSYLAELKNMGKSGSLYEGVSGDYYSPLKDQPDPSLRITVRIEK